MQNRCVGLMLGLGRIQLLVHLLGSLFEQVFCVPPGESETPWVGSVPWTC